MLFVSEPITPDALSGDLVAMARGEPGLPGGFTWRGEHHGIVALRAKWKSNAEAGEGRAYLRRHWFEVSTDSGMVWTLYCLRQAKKGGQRWWLYTVESKSEG